MPLSNLQIYIQFFFAVFFMKHNVLLRKNLRNQNLISNSGDYKKLSIVVKSIFLLKHSLLQSLGLILYAHYAGFFLRMRGKSCGPAKLRPLQITSIAAALFWYVMLQYTGGNKLGRWLNNLPPKQPLSFIKPTSAIFQIY